MKAIKKDEIIKIKVDMRKLDESKINNIYKYNIEAIVEPREKGVIVNLVINYSKMQEAFDFLNVVVCRKDKEKLGEIKYALLHRDRKEGK